MKTKKIAILGTNSQALWQITEEILQKGHSVMAIVDDPREFRLTHSHFVVVKGNIFNTIDIAKYIDGYDTVVCLYEPETACLKEHIDANRSLITAAKIAGVNQVISLGHPMSLKLENTKVFFDLWKPVAFIQSETLDLFKKEDQFAWAYLHSIDLFIKRRTSPDRYTVADEISLSKPKGLTKIIEIDNIINELVSEVDRLSYVWQEIETSL
jgi:putative NADH-flavin reductase